MTIRDVELIKIQFEQTIAQGDTIDVILNKFLRMCQQQYGHEWDTLLIEVSSGSGLSALLNQFEALMTP